jgi:hypothetical protein
LLDVLSYAFIGITEINAGTVADPISLDTPKSASSSCWQ